MEKQSADAGHARIQPTAQGAARLGEMSAPKNSPEVPIRRLDRFLAVTALGLATAAVLCFFTIIIASAMGMSQEDFSVGMWPLVGAIPLWGLPLAMVMILTLLITSFVRRGRAARRS